MRHAGASPYRTPTSLETAKRRRGPLPDADFLVPLAVLWPAFLAVVVRALVRGETFGAGMTLCAAIAVFIPTMFVSAWRQRG